jgi:hypothetical protein
MDNKIIRNNIIFNSTKLIMIGIIVGFALKNKIRFVQGDVFYGIFYIFLLSYIISKKMFYDYIKDKIETKIDEVTKIQIIVKYAICEVSLVLFVAFFTKSLIALFVTIMLAILNSSRLNFTIDDNYRFKKEIKYKIIYEVTAIYLIIISILTYHKFSNLINQIN